MHNALSFVVWIESASDISLGSALLDQQSDTIEYQNGGQLDYLLTSDLFIL